MKTKMPVFLLTALLGLSSWAWGQVASTPADGEPAPTIGDQNGSIGDDEKANRDAKQLETVEREEPRTERMVDRWDETVIVCKSMRVSGSRQTKRVCHSKGEWEAMRSNAEDSIRYIDSQPRLVPTG